MPAGAWLRGWAGPMEALAMTAAFSRRTAMGAIAASLALPAPVFALSIDDQTLVDRAVAYLDGLGSAKTRFTQSDARGDTVGGVLYVARPGRARFQYDPPATMLITSDGQTVTITDSRLKTLQRIPLRSTPLAIFLADHIRLDHGVQVTRVDRAPGGFSITARSSRGLAQGEITLYFLENPMRLTGWVVVDAEARSTRVTLAGLAPIATPPPEMFVQS